jgi:glutamate/tyrosine decarboxylase-like PLP-dependent enzyme
MALTLADSVAIDPHKWLYVPLEAGCVLTRTPQHLLDAFSWRPPYYHIEEYEDVPPIFYYEYGLQNSRGFRALKVWLALQQAGRAGYRLMIGEDCRLARRLYDMARETPEIEALSVGLSITTFRYVPPALAGRGPAAEEALNALNQALLERIQADGRVFISNAVAGGRFALRSCIVNFRTTEADLKAVLDTVVELGRAEQVTRG